MDIMSARVHDAIVLRTVCDIAFFLDRERVHVEADTERFTATKPAFQDTDYAGFTNTGLRFDAQAPERFSGNTGFN